MNKKEIKSDTDTIKYIQYKISRMFVPLLGKDIKKKHLKKIHSIWLNTFTKFCLKLSKDDIKEILNVR